MDVENKYISRQIILNSRLFNGYTICSHDLNRQVNKHANRHTDRQTDVQMKAII